MTMPVLVSICGDPGGAAAIAPVLSLVRNEQRLAVKAYVYGGGRAVLEKAGVPCIAVDQQWDVSRAQECLRSENANALLAASSVNDIELEKCFVLGARALGRPSIGVLDFWSNYRQRFADTDGALRYAPDLLAVMDEHAAADLRELGFSSERLIVTGQPAFDGLVAHRAGFTDERRHTVRTALGAGPDDTVVLFVSQPFTQLYASGLPDLGFDEQSVLALVVDVLSRVSRDARVIVAVRLHPRGESMPRIDDKRGELRIVRDRTLDGRDAAMAADLVVGMNSVLLLEACYLGQPVLSLQPGLRGRDALPSNEWRVSQAAYSEEEGTRALRSLATSVAARRELAARTRALVLDGCSAERVKAGIYGQLVTGHGKARV